MRLHRQFVFQQIFPKVDYLPIARKYTDGITSSSSRLTTLKHICSNVLYVSCVFVIALTAVPSWLIVPILQNTTLSNAIGYCDKAMPSDCLVAINPQSLYA